MSDSENIIEIIREYQRFQEISSDFSLSAFGIWLARSGKPENTAKDKTIGSEVSERAILYLLNRVTKFSRIYSKRVIEDLDLSTIDEFYFLLSVEKLGAPMKNEVYDDTLTELTTGAQIMKRLINMGFITEFPDDNDKRIRRVAITESGLKIKNEVFRRFGETVRFKLGNLDDSEKKQFYDILRYLDSFHTEIIHKDPGIPVDELIKKYIL
ncbi:MAG: MarR family winged helix-turn-helix transcriptional regulator [Ignavibacteriaceae bacterium]|nr:MarR family winged helix-turn-helix transcriptional regulator [Ignavibacteriaceae bacterium]